MTGPHPFYGVFWIDDPRKYELVSVRVLRAFMVDGKRVEAGEVTRLIRTDAIGLQHNGKCKIV